LPFWEIAAHFLSTNYAFLIQMNDSAIVTLECYHGFDYDDLNEYGIVEACCCILRSSVRYQVWSGTGGRGAPMKQKSELYKWCKAQEQFLRFHLRCLKQGRIRVHAVENNRFIDTTDEITEDLKKQLADLRACLGAPE
jgi:hypothetical protein